MIEISVVIGARNQRAVLEATLEALASQSLARGAYEVVVVDSASTDGTRDLCLNRDWPMSLRYAARENAGKCAARNDAIRLARGGLVFLTDADVVAEPDLLARHAARHASRPGCVVVGRQRIVDRLDEIGASRREALRGSPRAGARLTWRQFVTGNASVARQVLIEAGSFDEDFQGYGYEDYELGYRLAQRGVTFVYEPAAVNWHCHKVGFDEDLARKREAGAAAVLFARKHPSRALRTQLGLHPLNRFLWRWPHEQGWLARVSHRHRNADGFRGRLARWFLLEYAFQSGVRHAWSTT
jgi:glycosyltransferase involved in cell wall biosynthesis